MFKSILHHSAASGDDCHKLCCTKIENFGVSFGETKLFSDVNMHVHCGQLTAIIGPNGAGKSTFLKAVLGEVPHTGTLHYVDAKGKHTGHPVIGYVPQYLRFDVSAPTSVMDIFMSCLSKRPVWLCSSEKLRTRVAEDLARVQAEHLIDRRLGALSGGELQRVLLALALDPMPDLLLLDEPVSGVDHNGIVLFYEILDELRQKEDMAIILISHDLRLMAKHADQVVLLDHGTVTSGTPKEVFLDPRTQAIFGVFPELSDEGEAQ